MQGQPERQDNTAAEDGDQSSNRRYTPSVRETQDVEWTKVQMADRTTRTVSMKGPVLGMTTVTIGEEAGPSQT